MTRSWLCLPLLLVGALLLGQPVWGAEEEEQRESEELHVPEESEEQMVPTSPEELEAMESFEEGVPQHFESLAVDYFNKLPYYDGIYKSVEAKLPKFKQAIGTMVHMKVLLAKTDCRKEDRGRSPDMRNHLLHYMYKLEPMPELKDCNLPPPDEQENLNCNFGIFMDARSGSISVAHHKCTPLHVEELW